jgi:hypothetical protein
MHPKTMTIGGSQAAQLCIERSPWPLAFIVLLIILGAHSGAGEFMDAASRTELFGGALLACLICGAWPSTFPKQGVELGIALFFLALACVIPSGTVGVLIGFILEFGASMRGSRAEAWGERLGPFASALLFLAWRSVKGVEGPVPPKG